MAFGKAISLFLIDATPTGRIAAELHNWTGKAYKLPRKSLQESSERSDIRNTGVYFLFGRNQKDIESYEVYVGEAEDVFQRLNQHKAKDFWSEAVVFVSKDENLNKAHIKFLEFEAIDSIKKAQRAILKNANTPSRPSISEVEKAVMSEFFENLKLLVSTLGYKIFEPLTQTSVSQSEMYFINAARGANARAILSDEGVVVLADSVASTSVTPSAADWVTNIRERLQETNILKDAEQGLLFTKDQLFSSPSTAAAVVMGRSANGLQEWKDRNGKSLKDNEVY